MNKAFLCIVLPLLLCGSIYAQSDYQLTGYVLSEESKECLIGAVVWSGDCWTVSNEYGYFSLKLKSGKHIVKCSFLGRQTAEASVSMDGNKSLDFTMSSVGSIDEAVLEAEYCPPLPPSYMGVLDIPKSYITNMPSVLGEPDLLKTLQKMPGVQGGMEGFSGMYVRGGGSEENLMLLDGVPIYNATHLLGLFSSFTPEAIKQVTFYKGFFPAKYGGRASSVLDVRTNEGSSQAVSGTVSVGLLDGRFYIEGPIWKDRTSFSLSLRGMNTLVVFPFAKAFGFPYYGYFYDVTGKLTHRFKNSDRLYLSFYHGRDRFDYKKSETKSFTYKDKNDRIKRGTNTDNEEYGLSWGNTMAAIRWNHTFGGALFSDLSASWTSYKMNENSLDGSTHVTDSTYGFTNTRLNSSRISDINVVWDFLYNPSSFHKINFGISGTMHSYSPERKMSQHIEKNGNAGTPAAQQGKVNFMTGGEYALYLEDDFNLGHKFSASVGVRATLFTTQGNNYFSFEPRVSMGYKIIPSLSVKASYSKMSQYAHMLASGTLSLPSDLWVPITKNIKPVLADQVSVGLFFSNAEDWQSSVEAYYKKEKNVLEYKDSKLVFTSSNDWEQDVEMGIGTSKGIELLVQKNKGAVTGSLSYTLSKTDRVFPDGTINAGKPFPFTYDRRHVIDIFANWKINDRVSLNGSWSFASGNMMTASWRTIAVIDTKGNADMVSYISGRNNYRLPPSHRLDLSVNLKKKKAHGERIWSFGLYNVYGAKNPNWVVNDHETRTGKDGEIYIYNYLSQRTFLTIMPSVNYTFNFR